MAEPPEEAGTITEAAVAPPGLANVAGGHPGTAGQTSGLAGAAESIRTADAEAGSALPEGEAQANRRNLVTDENIIGTRKTSDAAKEKAKDPESVVPSSFDRKYSRLRS